MRASLQLSFIPALFRSQQETCNLSGLEFEKSPGGSYYISGPMSFRRVIIRGTRAGDEQEREERPEEEGRRKMRGREEGRILSDLSLCRDLYVVRADAPVQNSKLLFLQDIDFFNV